MSHTLLPVHVILGCNLALRVESMVISYKKLWVILEQRRITKKELCHRAGISMSSLRNLTRDQNVSLVVLSRICAALHVNLGDIAKFVEV